MDGKAHLHSTDEATESKGYDLFGVDISGQRCLDSRK